MPKTSLRAKQTHASPFRKLAELAEQEEAKGKKIYYLNIGQPDIKTPAKALQRVKDNTSDIVRYSPAKGIRSYREKLLVYYDRLGIDLSIDDLIVTSGASEGIWFLMLACLENGDEVIVPEPLYANYIGFSNMTDVKVVPITSTIETGFALPDSQVFEQAITARTKGIFICNPNNPTGALYDQAALEDLARLAKKHDLFLFVDEVYREFCYDGQSFYSALNLADMDEHVVVIDSISKRYSSCGARIGTIVTRNHEVIEMIHRYAQLRLSAPFYGQMLAEAALDQTEYLNEVKAAYENRRNVLVRRLQAIEGVVCHRPGGAFYVFVQLPIDDAELFCKWLVTDFDHNGATLMISPGPGFYATPNMGKKEVRIAYVLNESDLESAMDCLEVAINIYKTTIMKTIGTNKRAPADRMEEIVEPGE